MPKELIKIEDYIEFVEAIPKEEWSVGNAAENTRKCFLAHLKDRYSNGFVNNHCLPDQLFKERDRLVILLFKYGFGDDIAFVNDSAIFHDMVREHWLNILNSIKNASTSSNNSNS